MRYVSFWRCNKSVGIFDKMKGVGDFAGVHDIQKRQGGEVSTSLATEA